MTFCLVVLHRDFTMAWLVGLACELGPVRACCWSRNLLVLVQFLMRSGWTISLEHSPERLSRDGQVDRICCYSLGLAAKYVHMGGVFPAGMAPCLQPEAEPQPSVC